LDLPILGTISELGDLRFKNLIVGIGDNRSRRRIFTQLRTEYKIIPLARHPSAVVAPEVTIGMGTVICAGVIVNPGSVIGENVILNTGCVVEHHNEIGSHSHIGPGACLGGDVIVGEETLVGIGATVMPGVRIGTRSVVGAGALVRNDVPDGTAVAGVPAKEMRTGAIP
jgi:sugar O-acyltransferase (sialic acid O-acetyltransferase NeuD family)